MSTHDNFLFCFVTKKIMSQQCDQVFLFWIFIWFTTTMFKYRMRVTWFRFFKWVIAFLCQFNVSSVLKVSLLRNPGTVQNGIDLSKKKDLLKYKRQTSKVKVQGSDISHQHRTRKHLQFVPSLSINFFSTWCF